MVFFIGLSGLLSKTFAYMYHTRKLGTENPPRSDLFVRRRTLMYVKEAKMEPTTKNTTRNTRYKNQQRKMMEYAPTILIKE